MVGLVDFLVRLITSHLAYGVLEHDVLLEEMVDRHLIIGIIVHGALEKETEETLYAKSSGSRRKVAEQTDSEPTMAFSNKMPASFLL